MNKTIIELEEKLEKLKREFYDEKDKLLRRIDVIEEEKQRLIDSYEN